MTHLIEVFFDVAIGCFDLCTLLSYYLFLRFPPTLPLIRSARGPADRAPDHAPNASLRLIRFRIEYIHTVEYLNNGHIGDILLVHRREVLSKFYLIPTACVYRLYGLEVYIARMKELTESLRAGGLL